MALCKYIERHGVRMFSVCSQHLNNKPDLYTSYKHPEKTEKDDSSLQQSWGQRIANRSWDEKFEVIQYIRRERKKAKTEEFASVRDELFMKHQRLRMILMFNNGLQGYLDKRQLEFELRKQSYIEKRVDMLGPDLAAAHFIVNRGGRVKFWGHKDWITADNMKKLLPTTYAPGLYVLCIDATNTGLYYEGVDCLRYLNKMKWLRLKGLTNLNDFSLDIISGRYGAQLEYLDLTGCTGITHHGLESFYRFKCLKGLNVTGLKQSPQLHLTCLMIQDLLPNLDIIGLDYSQYLKDEAKDEPYIENLGQSDKSVVSSS